ncbi:MAG: bifunctional chorismate mutase/prephenate dehydratase [Clostridiales bacterium]|nr:bifunctional chorismate mutase/prephenate dehydratase [Clostridiales bacterium]
MEELSDIRREIDGIDEELLRLFCRRLDCSRRVAEYKQAHRLPILNQAREEEILAGVRESARQLDTAGDGYAEAVSLLFAMTMDVSRALQHRRMGSGAALRRRMEAASSHFPPQETPRVVCAGCPGAYADEAASLLFPQRTPRFVGDFSEVFDEVSQGRADYGVVPVENSCTGSVHEVYDLVMRHCFTIAAAVEVPVRHCLLAVKGANPADLRTVYSHPQGLLQCSDRLAARGLEPRTYSNTAAAARMVAEKGDPTVGAVSSAHAASLYGLDIVEKNIQNIDNNSTRFIAITRSLILPADADRISLIFSLPHVTGSLYRVLARFSAAGLNLTKLESRPTRDRPSMGDKFTYVFYLDFEGSLSQPGTVDLLCSLSEELPAFRFLGNYREQGPERDK